MNIPKNGITFVCGMSSARFTASLYSVDGEEENKSDLVKNSSWRGVSFSLMDSQNGLSFSDLRATKRRNRKPEVRKRGSEMNSGLKSGLKVCRNGQKMTCKRP